MAAAAPADDSLATLAPPDMSRERSVNELHTEKWSTEILTVVVLGASGDLAKKKTYPALFALYTGELLPGDTLIVGYARTPMKDEDFRARMEPALMGKSTSEEKRAKVRKFLQMCVFRAGQYDSSADFARVSGEIEAFHAKASPKASVENRLFYLALPPAQFVPAARSIKEACSSKTGYNRLVVEKPFGVDTESAKRLGRDLGSLWDEKDVFRVDHFVAKEMVQNLIVFRFANAIFEPLWNRNYINSVQITFKEDIGTYGRGGYFDESGIIRDVIQNHLFQMLCIVAMEPPVRVSGGDYANFVRDEKVKVLKAVRAVRVEDVVLGQYTANPEKNQPGYLDDPTVPAGSTCPTFATMVLYVDNARWQGVPWIIKAGKGLDQRKTEVRIQFKVPPAAPAMFGGAGVNIAPCELVCRVTPDEAIYLKTNVKAPGLHTQPVQSELDLQYSTRYPIAELQDAYVRVILDVLRGKQAMFVRDDELLAAWEIITPVLEATKQAKPIPYVFGSRGPKESDELVKRLGVIWSEDYAAGWREARKAGNM